MKTWLNKRNATAGTAALMAALTLAACSSEEKAPAAEESVQPPKRATLTVSAYDRGRVPAEEGTMEKNRWTDWINQNGPADIKYVLVPRNESVQKFNTLFASGSAPDIINEYDTNYRNKLYAQKQIQPLDELIEKHSTVYKELLKKYPALKRAGTKPDGKLYETGRLQGTGSLYTMMIRADWLTKLNLPMPTTPEEMLAVAKAFTEQDPDGNGKKDTFGISLASFTGVAIDNMFGNTGFVKSNDSIVWAWDRFNASMAYKIKLFQEGVVDRDYLTDKNGEKATKDWLSGRLGMYVIRGGLTDSGLTNYETLKKNVPGAQIAALPLPKTEFGQFSTELGNPIQMTSVVNVNAKDPVAAIKHIDFMAKTETFMALRHGLEGVHYKLDARGCVEVTDAEKVKKELVYTGDLWMMSSSFIEGEGEKCGFETRVKPDTPIKKEFLEFRAKAREAYESPERPYPAFAISEHMPTLPTELQTINTDLRGPQLDAGKIGDIVTKAIVSGSSYPADKALQDAKAIWEQMGGKKLEEFYTAWYKENKDNAFLTEDVYEVLAKQNGN